MHPIARCSGRRARAYGTAAFELRQCRGCNLAGFGFRSFRRRRWKRISTFRTLAAHSPHALMLSGGRRSVLRTHVARLSVPRHPACCIGAFAHFPACETRPMRLLVLVIVTGLGTGPSLAQTNVGGSSASAAGAGSPDGNPTSLSQPSALSRGPPSGRAAEAVSRAQRSNLHDRAVAACKEMWDAGTHMTKQQWSNTCKRIQTRLDNLGIEATMPKAKAQIR